MFLYYFSLTVLTIGIAIFNFSISSNGNDLTCYSVSKLDENSYQEFIKINDPSKLPGIYFEEKDGVRTYTVPVQGSNTYSSLATIIGLMYIIISGLSFLLMLIFAWMSDMVPDDFLNISWFKKFLAVTTKLFPPLIVIISWVIGILVIVLWILVGIGSCKISTPATATFNFNPLLFQSKVITLQIVNSAVWFLFHFIFAVIKSMVYIEPFMYAPIIGEPNALDYVLKVLGP